MQSCTHQWHGRILLGQRQCRAGRECSGLMNHATGTYVNNGKDVIDVMTKGYFSNDPSYTLESLYNNAPQ